MDDRARRYVEGLTAPTTIQDPSHVDGDPQFAALCEYMTQLSGFGQGDVVIDVGAGRGVVARAMMEVTWPTGAPLYVAVDLEQQLEALSLPITIHNHSRKLTFDEFVRGSLELTDAFSVVVIIRNVLHELNIQETTDLLVALANHHPAGSTVFIQDLRSLPTPESRSVPWDPAQLERVLREVGFAEVRTHALLSRSGTPWFSLSGRTPGSPVAREVVGSAVRSERHAQHAYLLRAFDELDPAGDDYGFLSLALPRDLAALQLQMQDWDANLPQQEVPGRFANEAVGPLVLRSGAKAFFVPADEGDAEQPMGLMGSLLSKDAVDMSLSIDAAVDRVWLWGFSNRRTFSEENERAIERAVARGVDVRVLLTDPESQAASQRASEPAYESEDRLLEEIRDAVRAARWLLSGREGWADVRLAATRPPASYFFVDDACVASFYTAHLTGTTAPSLVFRPTDTPGCFAKLLEAEFDLAFSGALRLEGL